MISSRFEVQAVVPLVGGEDVAAGGREHDVAVARRA